MGTLAETCARPVNFAPISAEFDSRSLPGSADPSSWRWLQNVDFPDLGKICRMPGWERLFRKATGYNNQDLHDQLLSLLTYYDVSDATIKRADINSWPNAACGVTLNLKTEVRQPPTFLFEAQNSSGFRKLLVGTQTRLYASNESRGSYKVLAYGMGGKEQTSGCSPIRWHGAQAGDFTLLTNNVDVPQYWLWDGPSRGCDQKSIAPLDELALIGVTKAAVVAVWKGVVFFADLEMDGLRVNHRVIWSDKDKPLSYDPAKPSSIAGYQDLDYGEQVLGIRPLLNSLYILTTKGIWEVTAIGGDAVFQFRKVYDEPESGAACIAYRNTLTSDGTRLRYLGTDGIYSFNAFMVVPEREPWMHLSTNTILDDFNDGACDLHVAGFNQQTKQMWLSWASAGSDCPNRTMVFNLRFQRATYVDHGFSAFVTYNADKRDILADFLLRYCICTPEQMDDFGITPLIKEPLLPSCAEQPETPACTVPQSLYTSQLITVNGLEVEDYSKSEPDEDSLCALLAAAGITTFDDLCQGCPAQKVFVMASMADFALKQYGTSYNRERCSNPEGCGTYVLDGYESLLVKGPLTYGLMEEEKLIEMLTLAYEAEQQSTPSEIVLSVGTSGQESDPNNEKCVILWSLQSKNKRYLKCLSDSLTDHAAKKTRPSRDLEWPMELQGAFLYLKFSISGTGGASCFSRLTTHVRKVPSCLQG